MGGRKNFNRLVFVPSGQVPAAVDRDQQPHHHGHAADNSQQTEQADVLHRHHTSLLEDQRRHLHGQQQG